MLLLVVCGDRLVCDAGLRQRFADKARSSILSLEHDRVMDMMVSNYEAVIKDYHRPGGALSPTQSSRNDKYITFVYYFFSFLLFLATPLLKAYVCLINGVSAVLGWARRCQSGDCNLEVLSSGAHAACISMTFREKMRVLAGFIYLFAIIIIYQSLRSVAADASR